MVLFIGECGERSERGLMRTVSLLRFSLNGALSWQVTAFVVLNYLPLGYQWKGSEKTLGSSLHRLAFKVKERELCWLNFVILNYLKAGSSKDFNHMSVVVP